MAKLDEFKTLNETELSAVEGGNGQVIKVLIEIGKYLYGAVAGNATEECRKHFDPRWCTKSPY